MCSLQPSVLCPWTRQRCSYGLTLWLSYLCILFSVSVFNKEHLCVPSWAEVSPSLWQLGKKNELLISWAEIFEDFQSLQAISQSAKFKGWIHWLAYSALKQHFHFSQQRPGGRWFTGELLPLHRQSVIRDTDFPRVPHFKPPPLWECKTLPFPRGRVDPALTPSTRDNVDGTFNWLAPPHPRNLL